LQWNSARTKVSRQAERGGRPSGPSLARLEEILDRLAFSSARAVLELGEHLRVGSLCVLCRQRFVRLDLLDARRLAGVVLRLLVDLRACPLL
jgi:hypothetical protein